MFIIIVGRKLLSFLLFFGGDGVTWSKINEWMSEENEQSDKKIV